MKQIKMRGIYLLMVLALLCFTFSVSFAQDPQATEANEGNAAVAADKSVPAEIAADIDDDDADDDADESEAVTEPADSAENVLDPATIAAIEAETALASVDGAAAYEDTDADYKYLTPIQYAKVKTKRKVADLILRFLINTIFCFIITRCFYFPKSRRRDFFFTYMLVGFAIFMLIHLMSGEKMETGIGMGLFAIFCIMRYRTESVPIREMTYLFVIIALAALNGMAWDISMKKEQFAHREIIAISELVLTNILFIIIVWISEGKKLAKGLSSKYVNYDKIDLIVPEKREELIEDLKKRTGLDITSVTIGNIDFLKDMAFIKIFYKDTGEDQEMLQKMPKTFG